MSDWTEKDAALSARLQIADQPGPLRSLAAIFAHSGDSWFWLLGLTLVSRFGGAAWRARAKILIGSIFGMATIVQVLKLLFRRARPVGEWGTVYRQTDPYSFPSGHASRAGLITGLGALLGPRWFGLATLIWGPLVALARVAMGVHYISDVLVGFTLGIGVASGIASFTRHLIPTEDDNPKVESEAD